MKSKWCFSVLIAAFALFVASQQQVTVPNQEIVLQFSDHPASVSVNQTVFEIKKQLQQLGASNTQVIQQKGQLKITYFSDLTTQKVKSFLLKKVVFIALNPKTKQGKYHLKVTQIQGSKKSQPGFDGKYIVEVKQEYTRVSQLTVDFSAITETITQLNQPLHVSQKVNTNISISVDKGTFNIPEVRAGPTA